MNEDFINITFKIKTQKITLESTNMKWLTKEYNKITKLLKKLGLEFELK